MNIYLLIKPLGIITYAFLFLTALSGLLRWKLKYHKTFAFTTIALATLHFIVIIIANS
jgi:hypothetical protein